MIKIDNEDTKKMSIEVLCSRPVLPKLALVRCVIFQEQTLTISRTNYKSFLGLVKSAQILFCTLLVWCLVSNQIKVNWLVSGTHVVYVSLLLN